MMADESRYPPHCQMMRQSLRERDWQQDIVAAVMGQSRSTVNAILTGRQRLTARLAIDYGLVLNLSPKEMLRQQDAWLLSITCLSDAVRSGIRMRVAETTARIAGDIQAELHSLEEQRTAIDERIAHLQNIPASALASQATSEVLLPEDAITQEGNGPLRKTDAQGPHLIVQHSSHG